MDRDELTADLLFLASVFLLAGAMFAAVLLSFAN